jgi:hypothetical protein
MNKYLTPGLASLLKAIRNSDEQELVYEPRGGWWVGNNRVDARPCWRAIRLCLLRDDTIPESNEFKRYCLNSEGMEILDNDEYVPLIITALKKR